MSDQMTFPDTWEEFEKHFGFNDIKQAYTFGNLRLIPSFRVQQWLNHEEFWIQGFCGVYRVKFTDGGVLYLDTDEPNDYRWRLHNIDPLLTGNAEILSSDDWRVKQTLKDLARQ